MKTFICKVLVALLLTCGVWASETGRVSAVPVCDVIVHVGDSLVSGSPASYPAAYYAAGFPQSVALGGGGRAISFPNVGGDGVIAMNSNGTPSLMWWNHKHSTLYDVWLVRWANTQNDNLCWVAAIGTNDAAHKPQAEWAGYINQLMAAIGSDPVLWVNMWANSPVFPVYGQTVTNAWNATLSQTLQAYPNATIYDWASYAAQHPEMFDSSGVHNTPAGYAARAANIAAAAQARWIVAPSLMRGRRELMS